VDIALAQELPPDRLPAPLRRGHCRHHHGGPPGIASRLFMYWTKLSCLFVCWPRSRPARTPCARGRVALVGDDHDRGLLAEGRVGEDDLAASEPARAGRRPSAPEAARRSPRRPARCRPFAMREARSFSKLLRVGPTPCSSRFIAAQPVTPSTISTRAGPRGAGARAGRGQVRVVFGSVGRRAPRAGSRLSAGRVDDRLPGCGRMQATIARSAGAA